MKCAVTCAKARPYSAAASSLKASSSAIPTSESLSFVLRMKCWQSRIVHCKLRAYITTWSISGTAVYVRSGAGSAVPGAKAEWPRRVEKRKFELRRYLACR